MIEDLSERRGIRGGKERKKGRKEEKLNKNWKDEIERDEKEKMEGLK